MNEEVNNPNPTGIVIGHKMKSILLSTVKWIMILCVVACIKLVYFIFLSMATFVSNCEFYQQAGYSSGRMMYFMNVMIIIGIIPSIIQIYSLILGFQFYSKAKMALLTDNEEQLTLAWEKLKYYFLWSVITAIVGFVIAIISKFGIIFFV